jgi:hypothetical protein
MPDRIWVEAYYRVHNGQLEFVRAHWRRKKRRDSATVIAFPHTPVA